jgi:hypothetical protein
MERGEGGSGDAQVAVEAGRRQSRSNKASRGVESGRFPCLMSDDMYCVAQIVDFVDFDGVFAARLGISQ